MQSSYYTIEAVENTANDIRKVYNGHDNIVAYIIPRQRISSSNLFNDLTEKPGVYILFHKANQNKIYIGETDNSIYSRLVQHNKNKEFWDTALAFVTKNNEMTGSQSKYLEGKLLDKAKEIGLDIDNDNNSNSAEMPKTLIYDADKWREQIIEITIYFNLIFFLDGYNSDEVNASTNNSINRQGRYPHPDKYILFGKEYEYDTWRQMVKDVCERTIDVKGYDYFKNKVINDEHLMKKRFALSKESFIKYDSIKDIDSYYYQLHDLWLCLHAQGKEFDKDIRYLYKLLSNEEIIYINN